MLILLLTLFPRSAYILLVLPFLIQLGVLVRFLSISAPPISLGQNSGWQHRLEKGLRLIFRAGLILTGYSLSYSDWGTMSSKVAFAATTAFAGYCLLEEASKCMRIGEMKKQGYTFSNPEWKIQNDGSASDRQFHLVWRGRKAPLLESEIPVLYELDELSRNGRAWGFSGLLKRIHALRTGFDKDGWTISPSGQPGIYVMYKADLTDLVTISKRDAYWMIRSQANKPEELLARVEQLASRLNTYRHISRHLKNVTYAGNHAVISTSKGQVYVDLHDGRVYRDDEWSREDSDFICIVPLIRHLPIEENLVVEWAYGKESKHSLEWNDVTILSKIFNISQETPSVKDLLR